MGRWLSRVDRGDRRRRPDPEPEPEEKPAYNPHPYVDPDQGVPVVPFLPVRCPRCGAGKPITHGILVARKRRYHTCQECDLRYRSIEISVDDLSG